jgi:hypothetical protein
MKKLCQFVLLSLLTFWIIGCSKEAVSAVNDMTEGDVPSASTKGIGAEDKSLFISEKIYTVEADESKGKGGYTLKEYTGTQKVMSTVNSGKRGKINAVIVDGTLEIELPADIPDLYSMEDVDFFGFAWHVVTPYDPGCLIVDFYFSDRGVRWIKKGEAKGGTEYEYVEYLYAGRDTRIFLKGIAEPDPEDKRAAKTNDTTLELKKGWNPIYTKVTFDDGDDKPPSRTIAVEDRPFPWIIEFNLKFDKYVEKTVERDYSGEWLRNQLKDLGKY